MYERFMNLIEKHRDQITKNIMKQLEERDELKHYREISEDVAEDHISQVVRNVYVRLGNWLDKNKPKDTLFAYYSNLGEQRCKEGIPLDEGVILLLMIKREIWNCIRDEVVGFSGFTLTQLLEINFYVNLFFDRIIYSSIKGYQNELGKILEKASKEKTHITNILSRYFDNISF